MLIRACGGKCREERVVEQLVQRAIVANPRDQPGRRSPSPGLPVRVAVMSAYREQCDGRGLRPRERPAQVFPAPRGEDQLSRRVLQPDP
jgi:hypothetical protein